jgi:MFS transporter, ACS family, hexuronate transporter
MKKTFFNYENSLLIILFLTFGLMFMDRMSFTFLMPFIVKDLGLSNTQSGVVLGILSLFFGLSTIIFSSISDLLGSKKKMLIVFVLLFSVATLAVGLIEDVTSMIVIRAIMGITEGPVIPLILAIVLAESTVSRRGFNMGLVKGSAPLMSGVLAPMILIPIAINYHWKWGFYVLSMPGFIMAIILWKFIKEPKMQNDEAESKPTFKELQKVFAQRNIWLCMLISIFYTANLTSFLGFSPLFVSNVLNYTESQLQIFLTVFGIGCFIWFFTIPSISDKFGRKPTLLFFAFCSMFLPLIMATFTMNFGLTIGVLLLLTCAFGYMPLFDSIIPAESVPHKYAASVIAGTILTGEVIGGTFGPVISGIMADKYDLHAPFYVGAIAAGIAFILSLGIKETKPDFV